MSKFRFSKSSKVRTNETGAEISATNAAVYEMKIRELENVAVRTRRRLESSTGDEPQP
jgi:hypothetical protein